MQATFFLRLIFSFIVSSLLSLPTLFAAATTLYTDPTPLTSCHGLNRFFTPQKSKSRFSWSLTPFYETTAGTRNKDGDKVPTGDRLGQWNTLALFYGFDASPLEKRFDLRGENCAFPVSSNGTGGELGGNNATYNANQNYPHLTGAFEAIFNDQSASPAAVVGRTGVFLVTGSGIPSTESTTGYLSVPTHFEKYGFRTQYHINLTKELSLIGQTGIASYKQNAISFNDQTSSSMQTVMTTNVTSTYALKNIAEDLGFNLNPIMQTGFEDTNIKIAWGKITDYKDEDANIIVSVSPILALGLWLPTGKVKNQDHPFSIDLGNQGFLGLSLEGALNFDFPGMITLGFGGGISVFQKRFLTGQRAPSDDRQAGLYPWKINLAKRLGPAWNFNVSLRANNFIDNLSFYCDYTYARKEKDEIIFMDNSEISHLPYRLQTSVAFTGTDEHGNPNPDDSYIPIAEDFCPAELPKATEVVDGNRSIRPATYPRYSFFTPHLNKVLEESEWMAQTISCGLDYEIIDQLHLGFGVTTYLAGVNTYRATTLAATVQFTF